MSWNSLVQALFYPEPIVQVIIGFSSGVLLSAFSWGFLWYITYVLIIEVILLVVAWWWQTPYDPTVRGGIIAASLFGFIVGREVAGRPVIGPGENKEGRRLGAWWRL
jgi:hypothetical protein